ncbi:hypothetical protein [Micromonospora craniellae]|uniref:Uncharacterized protein n=1 Tax=Micromonospora craniellae TaxID=2294034 RepID=A0A372FZP5_9ACTN|nr:hypothetical protein [Micromonospora craniellae]QOC91028.1 hypothetical protein ID554_23710 [Micromonospora craniellae]RFS45996.1 hypothetical protein D0Q02_14150 [Micromonospora craniellae]
MRRLANAKYLYLRETYADFTKRRNRGVGSIARLARDEWLGRAAGPAGAAPHAMVQQLLNQSDRHLWAVLSNGQRLRLLRDSTSLVGSSYVEFDLQSIFEGELFADFVLLFRMAHATRLKPQDEAVGPPSCLLEQWRAYGAKQGERLSPGCVAASRPRWRSSACCRATRPATSRRTPGTSATRGRRSGGIPGGGS